MMKIVILMFVMAMARCEDVPEGTTKTSNINCKCTDLTVKDHLGEYLNFFILN